MTFVITRLCRDCLDLSCVEVCPVDCIVEPNERDDSWPNQLFIIPDVCIDCGACEPECPWDAIFEDQFVPLELAADIDLNAAVGTQRDRFVVPDRDALLTKPTSEEKQASAAEWLSSG